MRITLSCVLSFLLVFGIQADFGLAEEKEGASGQELVIGGFVIRQVDYEALPSSVRDAIASMVKRETLPHVDAGRVEKMVREVLIRLEKEGIDTRQLFGGQTIPVYLTNASFGNEDSTALGYTIWYGIGHESNAIVMAGRSHSTMTHLKSVVHEIGHLVEFHYMDQKAMEDYRSARNIPAEWNNALAWTQRPREVFAEDFAMLFGDGFLTNLTEKRFFPEEEKQTVKALVVEQIKARQLEIRFANAGQTALYELKLLGIIPGRDFILHEMEAYEREPVTNRELIDWLVRAMARDYALSSFGEIRKLDRLYVKLDPLYADKPADKADVLAIVDGVSEVLDAARVTTWDVIDFMHADLDTINKGQAALIVFGCIRN